MVKIKRKDDAYAVSVGRRRMELEQREYYALKQAIEQFEKNDSDGELVAIEIDDGGFITVTRPLNPVAA